MAEEIADLTGSRITDNPYRDNVVFDTAGLNELLSHIKNYPVVDIDYIAQSDEDENGLPIWETYTEDTPCIKITYGDDNNLSGNISYADMQEIRQIKKQIALYNGVQGIYDKYSVIEKEYTALIANVQEELKAILINVCNTYHQYLNSDNQEVTTNDFSQWKGSYYNALNVTAENQSKSEFKIHIYPGGYSDSNKDILYYKINFAVKNIMQDLPSLLEDDTLLDTENFYTITYGVRNGAVINPEVDNTSTELYIIPFMAIQYNNQTGEAIESSEAIKNFEWTGTNLNESLAQYNWHPDELINVAVPYNNLLQQTIDLLEGNEGTSHVTELLKQYIQNIRNARVNKLESIRIFLRQNGIIDPALNTSIIEYGDSAYNAVVEFLMGTNEQEGYLYKDNTEREAQIQEILDQSIDDKYEEVDSSAEFSSDTQYYVKDDGGHYIPVTIEAFATGHPTYYTLKSDAIPPLYGCKYVKVGSNISWNDNQISSSTYTSSNGMSFPEVTSSSIQRNGHFRININNHIYEIGIKGFDYSTASTGIITVGEQGTSAEPGIAQLNPAGDTNSSLGTSDNPWDNGYITTLTPASTEDESSIGSSAIPYTSGYFTTGYFNEIKIGDPYTDLAEYINDSVTYDEDKPLTVTNETDAIKQTADTPTSEQIGFNSNYTGTYYGYSSASINTLGGIYAAKNIYGARVFNAVFNDYAEYRKTCSEAKPGMCVVDNDDGTMRISDGYLLPGAQIVSDTFGHAMGMTPECTTPIAVAGRVLAYPYQDRKNYHAGMCVCAAPGGTVNIMSRKDIIEYPDCIVGIVSEIPDYEYWGTNNVKVDGRIWIKVR